MAIKYVEQPLPAVETIDFKIQGWYGLNKNNANYRIGDLANCRNMTGEHYPYAAPRKPREVIQSGIVNPQKLFFNDSKLGYIADGKFYYDGEEKGDCGNTTSIVVYDNKICTFPSNKYYDALEDNGLVELYTKISIIKNNNDVSTTVPTDNDKMHCYINEVDFDFSTVDDDGQKRNTIMLVLKGFNADSVYTKFYNSSGEIITRYTGVKDWTDWDSYKEKITFNVPDNAERVRFYLVYLGSELDAGEKTLKVRNADVEKTPVKDYLIYRADEGNETPYIEYACEYNNRVVGIAVDDVYCSSLGDMLTWNNYIDETGSYATDVGTLGDFTGIIQYQGMVYMFKPDVVHQLYGTSLPFYVRDAFKTGCVDGKTICEVKGVLYWLGREGVYAYSGGAPRLISQDVFDGYEHGTACTDGRNYYICLNNGEKYETFVYDTYTGLWHRYDETPYIDLAHSEGYVYGLTADGDIIKFGTGTERVRWSFETHNMNFGMNERKNVSKVWIRTNMKPDTTLDVYVASNGGEYKRVAHYVSDNETMFDFKVRIKKADSFSLKFEGVGDVKILDIHAKVTVGTPKHRVGDDLDVYR